MPQRAKDVRGYLEELRRNKEGRAEQIKDAIDIYVELWEKAIEKGVVSPTDEISEALSKIEERGGLYKAADGQPLL